MMRPKTTNKLYLISTPIGHLEDITLRALNTLKMVDVLYAEDTRVTSKLLAHYNIKKPLKSYHNFNEHETSEAILKDLQKGLNVGLVSDAGTPLISDPGYVVVLKVKDAFQIESIPGPSAFLCALVSSGLPTQPHTFIGFLDTKKSKKTDVILTHKYNPSTLIFYERGSRLLETITHLHTHLSKRKAVIARELTKLYETFYDFYLGDDIAFEERGEFVLLVEGYKKEDVSELRIKEEVAFLIKQGLSQKEAIIEASKRLGVGKNVVYEVVIK